MKLNTVFITLVIIFLLSLLVWGINTRRTYKPVATLNNLRVGIFLPTKVGVNPDVFFAPHESADIRAAIESNQEHYKSMGIVLNLKGATTIRNLQKANQPDNSASFNLVIQTQSGSMLESGNVQTTRKNLSREIVTKIKKGFKVYEEVARPSSSDPKKPAVIVGF